MSRREVDHDDDREHEGAGESRGGTNEESSTSDQPENSEYADELDRALEARDRGDSRPWRDLLGNLLKPVVSGFEAAGNSVPLLPNGAIVGDFEIEGVLGRGGMGVVYAAKQSVPARKVALKVVSVLGKADSKRLLRFQMEVELLGSLRHPGIVHLYGSGIRPDGLPWFAMERIEGMTLHEWQRDDGISQEPRLTLFQALCEAIEHAHQYGVLHRDLKPTNIMVEADGRPRVLDFGVATSMPGVNREAQPVAETRLGGTLEWMSPEQVGCEFTDGRTDVYALGLILYRLITGEHAYAVDTSDLLAAQTAIQTAIPRPHPRVRGDLRIVLEHALAKKPEQRYLTVRALREDIGHLLRHEPIHARKPSVVRRTFLFARRHTALFLGITIGISALISGLVSSLIALGRERTAYARERSALASAGLRNRDLNQVLEQTLHALNAGFGENAWNPVRTIADTLAELEDKVLHSDLSDHAKAVLAGHVGNTLGTWNQYDRAIRLFDLAIELAARAGDFEPREIAVLHRNLGFACDATRDFGRAESHKVLAYEIRREHLAPDDPELIQSREELADLRLQQHRVDEAFALLLENVEVLRETERPVEYSKALNRLSVGFAEKLDQKNASRCVREALDTLDHHRIVESELRLALVLRGWYLDPAAIDRCQLLAMLEDAVSTDETEQKQSSPQGVNHLLDLSTVQLNLDPRSPTALHHAIRAYDSTIAGVGPAAHLTSVCRGAIAHALWHGKQGRSVPSILLEDVDAVLVEHPDEPQYFVRAIAAYAGALADLGFHEDLEPLLERIEQDYASEIARDVDLDLDVSHEFGQIRLVQRDPSRASRHYEHALAIARAGGARLRWRLGVLLCEYGYGIVLLGDSRQARDLLREGIDILETYPPAASGALWHYRALHGEALVRCGAIEEGLAAIETEWKAVRDVFGPSSLRATDVESVRTRALAHNATSDR